ncbi:MAG: class I SAM-dependent methyltransferase [Kofleriaceae bacterium]
MADLNAVKTKQLASWSTGDFGMIAWHTQYPCELLCEAVGLRAGMKVIDVATGSGNGVFSAVRRGCEGTGIDYVPALIERARERAAAERMPAQFDVADAEAIPYPDGAFDVVMSAFGSMFAPNQEQAAGELIRVCRPGGKIALANWTPTGFWGKFFGLVSKYMPPPPGLRPAPEWGTAKRIKELFGAATSSIHINERSALFRYRDSAHWIEVFRTYFGPLMRTLDALDETNRSEFLRELDETLNYLNRSGDDSLVMSADYLEIVMTKNK